MKHSFFGGVHPAGHKESTRRKPIARLDQPPEQVVLPVLMSPLGRAEPLVRPGDQVRDRVCRPALSGQTSLFSFGDH